MFCWDIVWGLSMAQVFFPIASQLKQEIGNIKSDWTKKTELCQIENI